MNIKDFATRWALHYVNPDFLKIPVKQTNPPLSGIITIRFILTDNPVPDLLTEDFLCSGYLYNVDYDQYISGSFSYDIYDECDIGHFNKYSGDIGDEVEVDPCFIRVCGEIKIKLPIGHYQYIEYECICGKIIKKPITFEATKEEKTINISHESAYLHSWIGNEEKINVSQVTKYEGNDDDDPYHIYHNNKSGGLSSSYSNTDRQGWNIGHTYVEPSGWIDYSATYGFYHILFETSMDWNVSFNTAVEQAYLQELFPWITISTRKYHSADSQTSYGHSRTGHWASSIWGGGSWMAADTGLDYKYWNETDVAYDCEIAYYSRSIPWYYLNFYVNGELMNYELNPSYRLYYKYNTQNLDALYVTGSVSNFSEATVWSGYRCYKDYYSTEGWHSGDNYYSVATKSFTKTIGVQGTTEEDFLDENTGTITTITTEYIPTIESYAEKYIHGYYFTEVPTATSSEVRLSLLSSTQEGPVLDLGDWLR